MNTKQTCINSTNKEYLIALSAITERINLDNINTCALPRDIPDEVDTQYRFNLHKKHTKRRNSKRTKRHCKNINCINN